MEWDQLVRKMAIDLAMLALQASIIQPLFGGGGVPNGGLFGSALMGLLGMEKRAEGGPVTAGVPYLVGERGPELFVPRMDGGIVPNVGGSPINVTMRMDLTGVNGEESMARIARVAATAAFQRAVQVSNEQAPAGQRRFRMMEG